MASTRFQATFVILLGSLCTAFTSSLATDGVGLSAHGGNLADGDLAELISGVVADQNKDMWEILKAMKDQMAQQQAVIARQQDQIAHPGALRQRHRLFPGAGLHLRHCQGRAPI